MGNSEAGSECVLKDNWQQADWTAADRWNESNHGFEGRRTMDSRKGPHTKARKALLANHDCTSSHQISACEAILLGSG